MIDRFKLIMGKDSGLVLDCQMMGWDVARGSNHLAPAPPKAGI